MAVNYYSLPRLLFFKKEGAQVDFQAFKMGVLDFVQKEFQVLDAFTEFSSSTYDAPDRDNQFIGGYRRSVYFAFQLAEGKKIALHFYDEESEDGEFQATHVFSFYSMSVYFVTGDDWPWIHDCWLKFRPFMDENQFYDATFRYTYDGGLYQIFKQRSNAQAMQEIVALTEADVKHYLEHKVTHGIEIQHKPYLNIQALLQDFPDKKRIQYLLIPHNGLTVWPEALFEFTELKDLGIYHNKIDYFDDRLAGLTKLRELNIHSMPLTQNPDEMRLLRSMLSPECRVSV